MLILFLGSKHNEYCLVRVEFQLDIIKAETSCRQLCHLSRCDDTFMWGRLTYSSLSLAYKLKKYTDDLWQGLSVE